ncbi:MAG: hypothetical protein AAF716_15855 [Cyanobacteria bacterium P01_D01_bin.1]
MSLNWLSVRRFIYLLFAPAATGLIWRVIYSETLAQQLLALALALFCVELAIMAKVDLDNIAIVKEEEDTRLDRFFLVVISTIVLEVFGFYTALLSLPVGALVVVFSQLWFNLLAGLQLHPGRSPAVVSFGLSKRFSVLLANAAGLFLLSLWFIPTLSSALSWELAPSFVIQLRRCLSGGLLALVVLFLLVKYVILGVLSITREHQK